MTETICLLAVFVIIEFLVIAFLLCSLSDIEGQRKVHNEMYTEMESRALNAESDLTQAAIKIAELTAKITRKNQKRVNGKLA